MGVRPDISASPASSRKKGLSIADGAVFVLCFVYSFWCVHERLLARDEGFYTYAAQLVREGMHPALDFFYPQMPLLPYLYGGGAALGGVVLGENAWEAYRAITAVFFGGILSLSYLIVVRHTGRLYGWIATLLIATCHLSFAWFTVVQTYAGSVLFLLLGVYLLTVEERRFRIWRDLCIGISFVIAVQIRLFFLPLCVLPVLVALFPRVFGIEREQAPKLRTLLYGYLIGVLPSLLLFVRAPESFFFSNLGYHLTRSSRPLGTELAHKWRVFEVLFSLGRPSQKFDGFQTPILFIGACASLFWWKKLAAGARLSLCIGALLFGISLTPNPTYVQYFVTIVPFAVIALVSWFSLLISSTRRTARWILSLVSLSAAAIFLAHVPTDMERYFHTGKGVIGIGSPQKAVDWRMSELKKVLSAVQRHSRADETVLALWPGYLVGTHRRAVPGTENHFGVRAAETLPPEEHTRYHLRSIAALSEEIRRHEIPLVVGHRSSFRRELRTALSEAGYQKVETIHSVLLFRKPLKTLPKSKP
ncbi:hypothetical protein MRY87_00575 [bacterium]|nr:hypothetical protein [bacterium]